MGYYRVIMGVIDLGFLILMGFCRVFLGYKGQYGLWGYTGNG